MSGPFATVRQTVSENRASFDRRNTLSLKLPVSNIYLGVLKTAEVPFHKLLAVRRGESDGEAISVRLRTVGDSSRVKITVRIAALLPPHLQCVNRHFAASAPARQASVRTRSRGRDDCWCVVKSAAPPPVTEYIPLPVASTHAFFYFFFVHWW